jgi:hypothetical protein
MKIRELLAEVKKPTAPKPRNFVAKNAPTSGAGRHKDSSKKKDQEQGKVKHKKDLVSMEGWSDAMVARRTGTPRTPYSVYIKGKKWKDFENDDHAEAVANKLKAKFKADGRDPSVITIAPTDIPEGMAETVTDTRVGMAQIYRKLAPKIERYKDSFLAGQLYDELENYAELHGAEREFKQMMNGARNRAHMEYDTNPGGFHNWFWFLPFADEDIAEGESAREKWNRASAEREKKHSDAEKEMNARHARGEEDMKGSIDRLAKMLDKDINETATAGATSAGNVAVGPVYTNKKGKSYKNKDGTVKNALDVKGANLMTGGSIKR